MLFLSFFNTEINNCKTILVFLDCVVRKVLGLLFLFSFCLLLYSNNFEVAKPDHSDFEEDIHLRMGDSESYC